MTDKDEIKDNFRSPALAWISLVLTLLAWILLMVAHGYIALAVAAAAVATGFFGLPGRSQGVRNLAITAIIASIVLLVVLTAFIIVVRVGLAAV